MFKIGDKVRVIGANITSKELYIGKTAIIIGRDGIKHDPRGVRFILSFDDVKLNIRNYDSKNTGYLTGYNTTPWVHFEKELEHIKVNYTRLAKKMFPKGHREGNYWVLGE